jgi:hypothetical protein
MRKIHPEYPIMKTQIRCLCSSFAACGLIGTLALLLALESYSATVDWSGGGTDNNWTTPANWTGGTAPVMGDSLQFFWQQTSQSNYNDYADLTLFNHIGVGGGSPSLFSGYSIGGDRIYLLGGISVSGPAFNLDPNISLRMYCDVTLGADQTFTAERPLSLNGFLNVASYRLDISNSASISISSLAAVTSNALANTVYKRGAGTLSFPAGSQIVSSLPAQFNLEVDEGNVVLAGTANGCVFYLTNHGSMVLNGSAHEVRFTSGVTNTLTGTGYADNLFSDAGGIFIPGTSTAPGILQCGSFIPGGNPAATFRVRLNGTNAGTGYSQMVVMERILCAGREDGVRIPDW